MNIGEGIICTQGLTSHQRRTITQLYREQSLIKLARGVYYPAIGYPDLSFRNRYSLHCLAYGIEGRTLVGRSAACLHNLPILYEGDCSVEVIGHTKRSGLMQRDLPPLEITEIKVEGYRIKVTSPAMTTIDLARWRDLGESVRVGDQVVAQGRVTLDDLERCVELRKHGPGAPAAREALGLINGLSESPRESEVKVALYQNGYPPPVQQAVIKDIQGDFIGRVDFFYPDRSLVLEYDGRGKTYGHHGNPYKAYTNEVNRERRLRSEGINVIRITNETWKSGVWLDQLARDWERGGPFPHSQWNANTLQYIANRGTM